MQGAVIAYTHRRIRAHTITYSHAYPQKKKGLLRWQLYHLYLARSYRLTVYYCCFFFIEVEFKKKKENNSTTLPLLPLLLLFPCFLVGETGFSFFFLFLPCLSSVILTIGNPNERNTSLWGSGRGVVQSPSFWHQKKKNCIK